MMRKSPMPQPTFQDLGIPFPLFEAPASEAHEYRGKRHCSLCRQEGVHCFELGIGAAVVVHCPVCAVETGLDANSRAGRACAACHNHLEFPHMGRGPVLACYTCVRSGRAAMTKDTELGMIGHEEALRAVTLGVPGLDHPDFEMVPLDDGWVGAKLPMPMMLELLRTPGYPAIQGETWLFCCKAPMVYVGEWSRRKFVEMAPDGNGRAFFDSVVQDAIDGLWEDNLGDTTGIYVFRCAACRKYQAHWDMF
jgi:uncharacterized protein CbrC (UPF0167 family)